MFYTLPNELIREITKWLSTQDKLRLMKVNSHLYNSISQNGLYESLSIYSEPHTEALVTRLACRPAQAIQVRSLLLKSHTLSDQLLRQLPIIFPGVKHFTDLSKNYGIKRTDPSRYLFRWANTIQVFDCLYDHIELCFYLENNTFKQLQQLVLTQYDCTKPVPTRLDLNLMECIKHAPSLTTLSLKDCQVDLDFMEMIHENCPNLNSLDFRAAFIRVIETKLPSTIVPAKPFAILKIDFLSVILDSHCVFRDYILEKYPCLKHFECLSSFMKTEFSVMCRYFRCTSIFVDK
jgi:hypothetical protein